MQINRTALAVTASVVTVVGLGLGTGIALLGNSGSAAPSSTVGASVSRAAPPLSPTPTASRAAVVAVKVSPSKHKVVRHRKARPAVVTNQEPAVTDPTTSPDPQPVNNPPSTQTPGDRSIHGGGVGRGPEKSGGGIPEPDPSSTQVQAGS